LTSNVTLVHLQFNTRWSNIEYSQKHSTGQKKDHLIVSYNFQRSFWYAWWSYDTSS